MRQRARVDGNHAEIRSRLRELGADVHDLSRAGGGVPDLLVHYRGRLALVECKTLSGKLTEEQEAFHRIFPVRVLRSPVEAEQMMAALGADMKRDKTEQPSEDPRERGGFVPREDYDPASHQRKGHKKGAEAMKNAKALKKVRFL